MNIVTLIEQYGMTYAKIGQNYRMNSSSVRDIYLSYKANGDQFICKKSNSGKKPTEAVIKATELV